jgi:hypothetical protein
VYDVNPLLFAASPPPPHAPSRYSQNSQNGAVPGSGGVCEVPSQNGYGLSQNSPTRPTAPPHPSAAAVVNGHARHLPDGRDGFETVPAAGGAGAVAEDGAGQEDGTWTFSA